MDTKNVIATLSQSLLDEVKKIMKKEKAEKSEKGESEADEKREHCSEALKGDQHKIDANKNGKVDAHDFHLLRKKKKVNEASYKEGETRMGSVGPITTDAERAERAKKYREKMMKKEEAEQIDELSTDTLKSYVKKARPDSYAQGGNPSMKKRFNRIDGVNKAHAKMQGTNEEAEQIDELSTKKLSDYRNKSLSNLEKREKKLKDGLGHGLRMTGSDDEERKIANRVSGIHTSSAKLKAKTGKYNPHPTVGQRIKKALKIEEVELTQEEIDRLDAMMADLEEGRGRPPKEGSEAWKKRQAEGAAAADEPRQHPIQQLERIKRDMRGGGDFLHKDGSTHHVKGGDAAKLLDKYHGLKPAEKEDMQREIHGSHAGLKKHL